VTPENPLLAAAAAASSSSEAHMFWWLYHSPQRVDNGTTPWPTVLWLQGGPVSEYIVELHMVGLDWMVGTVVG